MSCIDVVAAPENLWPTAEINDSSEDYFKGALCSFGEEILTQKKKVSQLSKQAVLGGE